MQVRGWLALTALGFIIVLAGCSRANPSIYVAEAPAASGAAGGETGGGPAVLSAAADPSGQLRYQQTTLAGPADQPITLNFQNPAPVQHNWVLVQPGQEAAVAQAAQAAGGNPAGIEGVIAGGAPIANGGEPIQIPPQPAGDYPYICTVPGHYAAGMVGTLTLGAAAGGNQAAPSGQAAASGAPAAGGDGTGLTVGADPAGQLKYVETTLQAKAGADFTVNFGNPAPLQHNWVLVQPGQEQAVADAAAAKGGDPTGITGVIAGGKPIANSSETVVVPAQAAGAYPYICTVPGHYAAGMKGELTVAP